MKFKQSSFHNIVFLLLLLTACKTNKTTLSVLGEQKVFGRYMVHQNDTLGDLTKRYVFTHLSGKKLHFINKWNQSLEGFNGNPPKDSTCYVYTDLTDSMEQFMIIVMFKNKSFTYQLASNGDMILSGLECSKPGKNLRLGWPDSANVVLWHHLNQNTGNLTLYTALESNKYPYYKINSIDSFSYNLNTFCTDDEANEVKRFNQALYNKYVKVQVTPNPFSEKFELTMTCDKVGYLIQSDEKIIHFYDDRGQVLLEQSIVLDMPAIFTFPNLKPGSMLFYRITWGDYFVAGQISKSR